MTTHEPKYGLQRWTEVPLTRFELDANLAGLGFTDRLPALMKGLSSALGGSRPEPVRTEYVLRPHQKHPAAARKDMRDAGQFDPFLVQA